MTTRAADDYTSIAARLAELRRQREQARVEAEALQQPPEEQPAVPQYFDGGCG